MNDYSLMFELNNVESHEYICGADEECSNGYFVKMCSPFLTPPTKVMSLMGDVEIFDALVLTWTLCSIAVSMMITYAIVGGFRDLVVELLFFVLPYGKEGQGGLLGRILRWWHRWTPRKEAVYRTKYLQTIAQKLFGPKPHDFNGSFRLREWRDNEQKPHPNAAARRSEASSAISWFIGLCGYMPYNMGTSSREQGQDGERLYYSLRDLKLEAQEDIITEYHMLKMVDVDYYYDMPEILQLGRPVMMYTFVPKDAAGVTSDGTFTMADDKVHHRLNGGGDYQHQLWDYGADFISVTRPAGGLFGFLGLRVETVVYSCTQKDAEASHRIIYLEPIVRLVGKPWVLRTLESKPLRRMRLSSGNVNCVRVHDGEDLMYSLSYRDQPVAARIPCTQFTNVLMRQREVTKKLGPGKTLPIGDIARDLKPRWDQHAVMLSTLLSEPDFDAWLMVNSTLTEKVPDVQYVAATPIHYQPLIELSKIEIVAREFAPCPWSIFAVIPAECHSNDVLTVAGRIAGPHNRVVPHYKFEEYAQEFVALVVPEPGIGIPISYADVIEEQDGPFQRARNHQEEPMTDLIPEVKIKAFQKREFYPEMKDPRNISQVPTGHTLALSGYTYAFKREVLKEQDWYQPGRTPREIAERMAEFVAPHSCVAETDFSRFDGTVSRWLRTNVEFACYLRWVKPCHKRDLHEMLVSELDAKGKTQHGVNYEADGSRLSGSPLTTDGNSIINAYSMYCSLREHGYLQKEALKYIGMIFGDDNVTLDIPTIEPTCAGLGLKVKVKRIKSGNSVGYLGRIFVDPWTTVTSVQDPVRTLGKINVTLAPAHIPLEVAARAKMQGYLVSDAHTPLIGVWARCMFEAFDTEHVRLQAASLSKQQQAEMVKDLPYAGRNGSWPQDPAERDIMETVVSERTGVPVVDIRHFEEMIIGTAGKTTTEVLNRMANCLLDSAEQSAVNGSGVEMVDNNGVIYPAEASNDEGLAYLNGMYELFGESADGVKRMPINNIKFSMYAERGRTIAPATVATWMEVGERNIPAGHHIVRPLLIHVFQQFLRPPGENEAPPILCNGLRDQKITLRLQPSSI